MMTWLLLSSALSSLALIFVAIHKKAPHRLNFMVTFLGLSSWLIPWSYIKDLLADAGLGVVPEFAAGIYSFNPLPTVSIQSDHGTTIPLDGTGIYWTQFSEVAFVTVTIIGLILFCTAVHNYLKLSKELRQCGQNANHLWDQLRGKLEPGILAGKLPEIRVQQKIPGGLNTGLLKNTIWIHKNLVDSACLDAVLLHELKHVRSRDNMYLLIITFAEKIFWWNPLARMLGKKCRQYQELSCDDSCARDLPLYRKMLSTLIISLAEKDNDTNHKTLFSAMFRDNNFNVERIRQLIRRKTMERKHIFSCMILASSSLVAISYGVTDSQAQSNIDSETASLILTLNDRNDDGEISRGEANLFNDQSALSSQMATILMSGFDEIDKDRNGTLNTSELAGIPLNFGINYQTVVPLQSVPPTASVMASNDTNRDGIITREEAETLSTPLGLGFNMFDLNDDNKITSQELDTLRMQVEQSSLPDLNTSYDYSAAMMAQYDLDQDGYLNSNEIEEMPIRIEDLPLQSIFHRWDMDSDSKLSSNELYALTKEAVLIFPPDTFIPSPE